MSSRACTVCGEPLLRAPTEGYAAFGRRKTCGNNCRWGTVEQRFEVRVERQPDGCWVWIGSIDKSGYGRLGRRLAHHVALELAGRPLPGPGLDTDHLCRVRNCVNPDHLEIVTRRENALRGENIQVLRHHSGHCKWGHPYVEHAYFHRGKVAYCKTCRARRRQEVRRAA